MSIIQINIIQQLRGIKMAQQIVDNTLRDQTFSTIRSNPENNFCIDCQKKNPRWASIYLGVHLCIDCAGKHRQFGVMYSFVKSTNLDTWNRRQLRFMQKGGNTRALQYFKKCGIISSSNKHIDYKSQIVQKYKTILTQQVDNTFNPVKSQSNQQINIQKKNVEQKKQKTDNLQKKSSQIQSNIQKEAQQVEEQVVFKKSKKDKKKINAKKINVDFQQFDFDDGVSQAEKQKMMKVSQTPQVTATETANTTSEHKFETKIQAPVIQAPKEMQINVAKQTLQKFKQKDNIKALSSQNFKQTNISSAVLQQNLNKFEGAQSISSAAFFGYEQPKQQKLDKVKNMISSAGEKLYNKLSSYLGK